jgi:hypothetical protein
MTGMEKEIGELSRAQAPTSKDAADHTWQEPAERRAVRGDDKAGRKSNMWIYLLSAIGIVGAVVLVWLTHR